MTGNDGAKPNVLLIVMDGVRARNTSLLGHENETTPTLETFADEAITYTQARSPGVWSLPSHASIFTGLEVVEHGVTDLGDGLQPGTTIWEDLEAEHDYSTGVFSENTWLVNKDVGMKDAFQTVVGKQASPYPEANDPNRPYHLFASRQGRDYSLGLVRDSLDAEKPFKAFVNGLTTYLAWTHPGLLPDDWEMADTPGAFYTDQILSWIDDQSGPWAGCINYLDSHFPYEPPSEHDLWGGQTIRSLQTDMDDQVWEFNGGNRPWWQREALASLYDGGIHYMDAEINRLLETLRDRDELENTLVVITADHGEGFGEPSRVRPDMRIPAHLSGLHEILLHVPLMVKYPDMEGEDGTVVDDLAAISAFPEVVSETVDGTIEPETGFVADDTVVASSHGLEKPMEKRAGNHLSDTWRFNGDAFAVYEKAEKGVRKKMCWRDSYSTAVTIPNAQEAYVSGDGGETVEEVFTAFTDRDIATEGSQTVSEEAKKDLEALGYM
ncbi:sulfatase-like hydrolase/transferase [Halodesulfurarchaeum sp.]|uniref:sulfatase-like hydrolase/transferase n=1 Tax=Halodesulfurarchaeum sp. TaxID=1980530 RepID=UPI002FC34673